MAKKNRSKIVSLADDGVLLLDSSKAKLDRLVIEDDHTYTAFVTVKVSGLRQVRIDIAGASK